MKVSTERHVFFDAEWGKKVTGPVFCRFQREFQMELSKQLLTNECSINVLFPEA
jgi:hypothetical protein